MTLIAHRTFRLAPKPWDRLTWVRVPDGLEFRIYEFTTVAWGRPDLDTTPDEEARWPQAAVVFEQELRAAQSNVRWEHGIRTVSRFMADHVTIRRWRYDLIPGRKARSRRSWERCVARMRAAEEVYRPVREEIEARLAAHAAAAGEGTG
ncbi:hypothetical protein [Embleya sp. AB8]|uniref:hypothetical protein n=1 Tax=Embleya sp. AB8 TaxID=3156304 RepID=UPI003C791233